MNFEINRFLNITKKSRQIFKYLENEKSFLDEIKTIFHHFGRAIIEANKKFFLEGESATLSVYNFFLPPCIKGLIIATSLLKIKFNKYFFL